MTLYPPVYKNAHLKGVSFIALLKREQRSWLGMQPKIGVGRVKGQCEDWAEAAHSNRLSLSFFHHPQ